jgi:periplasmic protein TonB
MVPTKAREVAGFSIAAAFTVLLLLLITILFGSCDKSIPELPAPPPPPKQPAGQIGVETSGGKLITVVKPGLPEAAKRLRLKGPVILQTKINEAGKVAEIRVVQGHPMLNGAAQDAVRRWKYAPLLVRGMPIAFWTTAVVNFRK